MSSKKKVNFKRHKLASKPRTNRQKAFAKISPLNWLPVVGETVYVRRTSGNLSFNVSKGVVTGLTLFDGLYQVTISRGTHRSVGTWRLEDVRPSKP